MEFILKQFNETRLPTSRICFEITETSAIGKLEDAIDFMERLKIVVCDSPWTTSAQVLPVIRTCVACHNSSRSMAFSCDIKNNPNDYAVVKSINEIGHFIEDDRRIRRGRGNPGDPA
ncbi:MAG: hypothetical protein U5O39_08170 [Gammaproteobacteria bacterium]|nr:hypothetical protein [Gammaproteobacteria bacterium]